MKGINITCCSDVLIKKLQMSFKTKHIKKYLFIYVKENTFPNYLTTKQQNKTFLGNG